VFSGKLLSRCASPPVDINQRSRGLPVIVQEQLLSISNFEMQAQSGGDRKGTKVFVGNLPLEAEARDLRDFFRDFGTISDAWVNSGALALKPTGFGFVWFDNERDARDACRDMDGRDFFGNRVRVEISSSTRSGGTLLLGRALALAATESLIPTPSLQDQMLKPERYPSPTRAPRVQRKRKRLPQREDGMSCADDDDFSSSSSAASAQPSSACGIIRCIDLTASDEEDDVIAVGVTKSLVDEELARKLQEEDEKEQQRQELADEDLARSLQDAENAAGAAQTVRQIKKITDRAAGGAAAIEQTGAGGKGACSTRTKQRLVAKDQKASVSGRPDNGHAFSRDVRLEVLEILERVCCLLVHTLSRTSSGIVRTGPHRHFAAGCCRFFSCE